MKKNFISLILLTIFAIAANSQHLETLDISEDDFKEKYNYDKVYTYQEETTYEILDTIYGIADSWGFLFENKKLQHVIFFASSDDLNETDFYRNLDAAQSLISDFTETYGSPDELNIGDTVFIDPYKERHWGYDVIEAKWITNGMKIKIEFDFFGGKGEYHFMFSVKYFDENYPYFD